MPILIAFLALAFQLPAHAVLVPSQLQGKTIVELSVPGKRAELCVIPEQIPGGKYGKKDEGREAELCGLEAGVNAITCPKTYSTNPGIDFYRPESGNDFESCNQANLDKRAKFKLSTSCSYTPALLSYYHFSRALGNVLNVPVAVVRTFDLDRHQAIAAKAIRETSRNPQDLIYKTWSGLKSILDSGRRSSKADLIFVEGYDQTYGALQKNPKGEAFYKEFFNGGSDRVAAFKQKNQIYRMLITPDLKVGKEFNLANLQAMQQLKDLSDMLVIDTVLGQQDRFGNIHFEEKYFYREVKDGKFKVKSEGDLKDVPAELQGEALKAKEMVLKDNDCGVAKENRIKKGGLLDDIAHMDPGTYKRLLQLEQTMDNSRDLFIRGMLFTETDFRTVRKNLREAAAMLQAACRAGKLKLDLDLDKHFSGAPVNQGCEL